ncbi:hypothetical protein Q8F55_002505 [Vanrija albida]|uniref:BZIP domain-containing protein n=1 Tax=Vanrija albida TaxID=181172 RepID=A0ABR3QAZ3_9TREE
MTQTALQQQQDDAIQHDLHMASSITAQPDLDPALFALATSSSANTAAPIDPALFAIEQVVHNVQRGRIGQDDIDLGTNLHDAGLPDAEAEAQEPVAESFDPEVEVDVHDVQQEADPNHIPLDDDGIDPALREIVNSLTNAQQSHHPSLGPGDTEERERLDRERLQHTLQSTLEDFAHGNFGNYGAIFNTNFPQSPNNHNLILPPLGPEAAAHTAHLPLVPPHTHVHGPPGDVSESSLPVKRGRGRPKGSKNKPKPGAPPPEVQAPPPRRPKGRPPKVRSAEELAEFERRKEERALGIKRKRGRPRKYPELGLVREMRLKKNRAGVQEKIRLLEERARLEAAEHDESGEHDAVAAAEHLHAHLHDGLADDAESSAAAALATASEVALGEQVAAAVVRSAHENGEHYDWPYQDGQSLLDVVGVDMVGHKSLDDTSGMAIDQTEEAIRGVFSLADVGAQ